MCPHRLQFLRGDSVKQIQVGETFLIRTDAGLMPFIVRGIVPKLHEYPVTHYPYGYIGQAQMLVSYTAEVDLVSCGRPLVEPPPIEGYWVGHEGDPAITVEATR